MRKFHIEKSIIPSNAQKLDSNLLQIRDTAFNNKVQGFT
jgi:hypothetical protein